MNVTACTGKFGCPNCLQEGESIDHGWRFCYVPFLFLVLREGNEIAEKRRELQANSKPKKGIKPRRSALEEFGVRLPEQTPLDCFHIAWENTAPKLFQLILSKMTNSEQEDMKKVLSQLRLPNNLNARFDNNTFRLTRNRKKLKMKAKHGKLLASSLGIPLLINCQAKSVHFLLVALYQLAVRMLLDFDEELPLNERQKIIADTSVLMDCFRKTFELEFGRACSNYTIHANQHLPQNVEQHGPMVFALFQRRSSVIFFESVQRNKWAGWSDHFQIS